MSETSVEVTLQQQHDFVFEADFGGVIPALRTDEPPPLGQGTGPSPVQMLTAAVANCLSDSLLFAFNKFKQSPAPLRCVVRAQVGRNAEGRMRVTGMQAALHLGVPGDALDHLERVLGSFESYCTVTQSVAAGIPMQVEVWDATGRRLK